MGGHKKQSKTITDGLAKNQTAGRNIPDQSKYLSSKFTPSMSIKLCTTCTAQPKPIPLLADFVMSIHKNKKTPKARSKAIQSKKGAKRNPPVALPQQRTYSIPDFRLEKPSCTVRQVQKGKR
jgi:hypothetical protein